MGVFGQLGDTGILGGIYYKVNLMEKVFCPRTEIAATLFPM